MLLEEHTVDGDALDMSHADAVFRQAFHPFARQVVRRGVAAGRFDVSDVDLAVTLVVGASLALIRAILEGHLDEGTEVAHAEVSLRALGVSADEARAVSRSV